MKKVEGRQGGLWESPISFVKLVCMLTQGLAVCPLFRHIFVGNVIGLSGPAKCGYSKRDSQEMTISLGGEMAIRAEALCNQSLVRARPPSS